MCTLTLIPLPGAGVRLVTNRDESRRRAPGLPPTIRSVGPALRAAYPVDGEAGGAWVAASDRGLLFALLNANLSPAPPLPSPSVLLSRGSVIPALLSAEDLDEVGDRLAGFALPRLAPFRLLTADSESVRVASWNRESLEQARYPLVPMCMASSGLGDERVLPRLALFDHWMERFGPTPEAQDAFHAHAWPDRPEISVMMSRADARTVSVTTVAMTAGVEGVEATMTYRDDSGEHRLQFTGSRRAAAGST
jgi:hypothetical protein